MLSFAQTVIGQRICNLAARALGKYVKESCQYVVSSTFDTVENDITTELKKKGVTYVDKIVDRESGHIVLIFEAAGD